MPRLHLAAALAGIALLSWTADAAGGPVVAPADAPRWEGQSVTVRGVADGVRRLPDGGARFDLVQHGHAVAARLDGGLADGLREGELVAANGRLARLGGELTLLADGVARLGAPDTQAPGLDALARDPAAWMGRDLQVRGTIERGRLVGEGHAIALGDGDWPRSGPASASVRLDYHAQCACYRLDLAGPWTS